MSKSYVVAVYLCDRAYGGPEEGGWWYNTGKLIRTVRVFKHEGSAIGYCRRFNAKLNATVNAGRRSIGSVLSTGRYFAEIHDNVPPTHYPEVRPHYE